MGFERGVEQGAIFEHGASDVEKAICNRSQSPAMTMPPAAQGGVFGFARWIMLNGDARPMVHGVGKPVTQACLRMTMQLLPDLLVTGATPAKLRSAA